MQAKPRLRLMQHRWASLLAAEAEGRKWMELNKPVLQRALAQLNAETILLHLYRWILLTFRF